MVNARQRGRSDASSQGTPRGARNRPSAPPRITDLAAELGYSAATISRALNGHPTVDPGVARRVREHAARRGYVANRLAQSLVGRSPRFIGFLVPDMENRPYSIAANVVARYLGDSEHQLIVAISGDDPATEYTALHSLVGAQVAALILSPTPGMTQESRQLLRGCPVVQFNRFLRLGTATVACHDKRGFADATRHLLELGHRDIAYLGTSSDVNNGRDRVQGVRETLVEAGLGLPKHRVRLRPPTGEDGYEAARELLTAETLPTALVVGSSNLSVGAARAVHDLGIQVPRQLSVIVYGDPTWGELYEPRLTTVAAPYEAMAEQVARAVTSLLDGTASTSRPPRHRLPTELLVRESTAPPLENHERVTACASRT